MGPPKWWGNGRELVGVLLSQATLVAVDFDGMGDQSRGATCWGVLWVVGLLLVARVSYAVAPGIASGPTAYPATGALIVFDETAPRLACTGTLITPNIVLTAAHCMLFLGGRLPGFVLTRRIADVTPGADDPALRVVVHPQFVFQAGGKAALHDLALVLLARPVRAVAPEALLSKAQAATVAIGDAVDLVGYGRMSRTVEGNGTKNRGRSKLVEIRPFEWVIGAPSDVQNCDGDSGGPAFVVADGKRRIMGIASRSVDSQAPCVTGTIHARVDAEAQWIAATLRSFSSSR
jgi:secreted trypsin-like serine protease